MHKLSLKTLYRKNPVGQKTEQKRKRVQRTNSINMPLEIYNTILLLRILRKPELYTNLMNIWQDLDEHVCI